MIKATPHIKRDVETHHIGFRTSSTLPENYDLDWMKGIKSDHCKTGYWKFDAASGKHIIRISPLAYNEISTDKKKRVQVPELFRHVYEHEAAHSLYTDKDLKGLSAILTADKIPWRLLNLFEDCRIERVWKFSVRGRRAWKWLLWHKHPEDTDVDKVSAQHLLYRIKCESHKYICPRSFRAKFSSLPFYGKVWKYYNRIVACAETRDLIPILKEWLKDFPHSGDDTIEGEGGLGTGDLAGAIKDDTGKAPSDVASKDPNGSGSPSSSESSSDSSESKEDGIDKATESDYGSECDSSPYAGEEVPTDPEQLIEFKLSHRLAAMLDTAFKAKGDGRETTSAPSKRLNVKGILRGDFLKPYIGKAFSDKGKPHVSILVDCSGSMCAHAFIDRDRKKALPCDVAGRVLLRALNVLAKRDRITCIAYATASGGVQTRVKLPVKSGESFTSFYAHSDSEGIGKALDPSEKSKRGAFAEVSSKGRIVLVYTDGCITDTPLDRKPLRSRGIHTIGVCCSATDTSNEMKHHFDSVIWRESLWGMADALVRQLKALPSK